MMRRWCRECGTEHWHNPLARKKPSDEQLYRCVNCGQPRRTGMAWNRGIRMRGRIVWLAPGQAV